MNANVMTALFLTTMCFSPASFAADDEFKVANPAQIMREGRQRRAETEALEAQARLLEAHTRQLELEIQAQQLELDRRQQPEPQTSLISAKDVANEYRLALYDIRVGSCVEERSISEQVCQSITSNELAVALDGYIRAEPYRSRQIQYVEARMAR